MKRLIYGLCVPALALVGCNSVYTESGLDMKGRGIANRSMVNDLFDSQSNAAVVREHTIYAHHFVPGSPNLNSWGEHDLRLLAEHYQSNVLPHLRPITVLTNVKVFFDYDKAALRDDTISTLQEAVALLEENPEADILITGHADIRGSEEYNLALAERRAAAVQNWLSTQGVEDDRIKLLSRGEFDAKAPVSDEIGMQEDRNAQFAVAEGQEFPAVLNVKQGSASNELYEARKDRVEAWLRDYGLNTDLIALEDGHPGGDGKDSLEVYLILSGENQQAPTYQSSLGPAMGLSSGGQ